MRPRINQHVLRALALFSTLGIVLSILRVLPLKNYNTLPTAFHFWSLPIFYFLIALITLSSRKFLSHFGIRTAYASFSLGFFLYVLVSFVYGFIDAALPARIATLLAFLALPLVVKADIKPSKEEMKQILWILLGFSAFLVLRSAIPSVWYNWSECWMDLALLSNCMGTGTLPLQDPWMAGMIFHYYYAGHYGISSLLLISRIPPEYGINVGAALVYAMIFFSAYSLISRLTQRRGIAILGTAFLTFGANPYTFIRIVQHLAKGVIPNPHDYYQFGDVFGHLAPAYIIHYTTEHTPAIGFFQRDLHACFIAYALFLSVLLLIFLSKRESKVQYLIPFYLGLTLVVNAWCFPFLALVLLISLKRRGLLILLLTSLIFSPFFFLIYGGSTSIGVIPPNSKIPETNLNGFLIFFAPQLFIIYGYFIINAKKEWKSLLLLLPLLFLLTRYKVLAIILPPVISLSLKRDKDFVDELIISSLLVLAIIEFLYVHDPLPHPWERYNTVFKFYSLAWTSLTVASFGVLSKIFRHEKVSMRSIPRKVVAIGFFALIATSMVYFPCSLMGYRLGDFPEADHGPLTLNGLHYLTYSELQGIYALRKFPRGVVLEAVNPHSLLYSYTYYARVSTISGFPTVIGWTSHEIIWRNNWTIVTQRYEDVLHFYENPTVKGLKSLVAKYHVKYIFVGTLEGKIYPGGTEALANALSSLGLKLVAKGKGWYIFVVPKNLHPKPRHVQKGAKRTFPRYSLTLLEGVSKNLFIRLGYFHLRRFAYAGEGSYHHVSNRG